MKIVTWILQVIVAGLFIMAGATKLFTPYESIITMEGLAWAADFSPTVVMIIGVLEFLGGIGVIIPMFLKKFNFFVPLAALGLSLVMVGAVITHLGRGEAFVINIILLSLALVVAFLRKNLILKKS